MGSEIWRLGVRDRKRNAEMKTQKGKRRAEALRESWRQADTDPVTNMKRPSKAQRHREKEKEKKIERYLKIRWRQRQRSREREGKDRGIGKGQRHSDRKTQRTDGSKNTGGQRYQGPESWR